MIKVAGTGSVNTTEKSRKKAKPSAAGGDGFAAQLSDVLGGESEDSAASSVDAAVSLGAVDTILTAQATDDSLAQERNRRAVKRGETLLDKLEEVREGLLTGRLPKERLISLAQMLRERPEEGVDPNLKAILDDIALRAEVELAKLSRS